MAIPANKPGDSNAKTPDVVKAERRKFWRDILVALIGAILGSIAPVILWQIDRNEKHKEIDLKNQAQERASSEESRRKDAEARADRLERDRTSIRAFINDSKAYLLNIKNLLSQLKENANVPKRHSEIEKQLIEQILAYGKFISDWKTLHQQMESLLDGDNEAIVAEAQKPNITAAQVDEIAKRRSVLEANLNSKQTILLEKATQLSKDAPAPK